LCDRVYTEKHLDDIERGQARLLQPNASRAEKFYRRHILNTADSPIAQVIVVGLLRSLLTTCSTNNLYTSTSRGVDINREWEVSLEHADECLGEKIDGTGEIILSDTQKQWLSEYKQFKKSPEVIAPNKEKKTDAEASASFIFLRNELERHRFVVSNTISSFFLFLLAKFKLNSVWQFSFLI
jgi:hypothetical protein